LKLSDEDIKKLGLSNEDLKELFPNMGEREKFIELFNQIKENTFAKQIENFERGLW